MCVRDDVNSARLKTTALGVHMILKYSIKLDKTGIDIYIAFESDELVCADDGYCRY